MAGGWDPPICLDVDDVAGVLVEDGDDVLVYPDVAMGTGVPMSGQPVGHCSCPTVLSPVG